MITSSVTKFRWRRIAGAALLIFAACATPAPPAREEGTLGSLLSTEKPNSGKAAEFDPKAFAAQFDTAAQCLTAAQKRRASSADLGWMALKACVEHGSFRGVPFTDLKALLADPWRDLVLRRPEGLRILARVVAQRGADVEADLKLIASARVPLLGLADVAHAGAKYKGQMVVFLGRFVEPRAPDVVPGTLWFEDLKYQVRNSDNYYYYGRRPQTVIPVRLDHVIQAVIPKKDPLLTAKGELVFFARFDEASEPEYARPFLKVTLLDYFTPSVSFVDP